MVKNKNIVLLWFEWHFINAPLFLLKAWRNVLLFNLRFFSVSFLLRTLFSHWHKYRWRYTGGFNISKYFEVLFSNFISRSLGAVMRLILIVIGIFIELVILFIGAVIVIFWIVLPAITVLIFILALRLIS